MTDFAYVGNELDLFAGATTWKSYVHFHLRPYLSGDILEVGAGIGAATATFYDGTQRRWVCLEPDRDLAARIKSNLPSELTNCEVVVGTLSDLSPGEQFDSILYMDVLEHIEADAAELARAASHLKPNGTLAILAPALPWLFTPFDAAVGHYRRYLKTSLRSIAPRGSARNKMYLFGLGRPVGVARKQTFATLAHPEQSPDPILGPRDGPDIKVHRPRADTRSANQSWAFGRKPPRVRRQSVALA